MNWDFISKIFRPTRWKLAIMSAYWTSWIVLSILVRHCGLWMPNQIIDWALWYRSDTICGYTVKSILYGPGAYLFLPLGEFTDIIYLFIVVVIWSSVVYLVLTLPAIIITRKKTLAKTLKYGWKNALMIYCVTIVVIFGILLLTRGNPVTHPYSGWDCEGDDKFTKSHFSQNGCIVVFRNYTEEGLSRLSSPYSESICTDMALDSNTYYNIIQGVMFNCLCEVDTTGQLSKEYLKSVMNRVYDFNSTPLNKSNICEARQP